jgi:hypothetical protein
MPLRFAPCGGSDSRCRASWWCSSALAAPARRPTGERRRPQLLPRPSRQALGLVRRPRSNSGGCSPDRRRPAPRRDRGDLEGRLRRSRPRAAAPAPLLRRWRPLGRRSGAPAARRRQARPALLRGCASALSPLDQQPVVEPPLPRGADAVVDLPRAHCRVCLWPSEWLSRRSRRTRCSSYAVGSQPARAVGAASGRLTTNVEPSPNSDSTEIVPPIRLTSSREMYRPRPLPLTPRIMFASAR